MNELLHIEFQSFFDEGVWKSGMDDVICALMTRDRIGIGCLFEPDATPNVFVGRKAVQDVTDNFAKSARDQIAHDRVPLVARTLS